MVSIEFVDENSIPFHDEEMKFRWPLLVLVAMCLSCGKQQSMNLEEESPCADQTIRIQITDSSFIRVCGCKEADDTVFGANEKLVCTLPHNSQVQFFAISNALPHQIVSTSSDHFQESPVMEPKKRAKFSYSLRALKSPEPTYIAYNVILETGTYEFKDSFNETLTGVFYVEE